MMPNVRSGAVVPNSAGFGSSVSGKDQHLHRHQQRLHP